LTPERYVSYEPSDLEEIKAVSDLGKAQTLGSRTRMINLGPGLFIQRYGLKPSAVEWGAWQRRLAKRNGVDPADTIRPDHPMSPDRKYVDLEGGPKMIDMHPNMRRDYFWKHGYLSASFFCLEGPLKADAAWDYGFQAFDVGGVSKWDSRDEPRSDIRLLSDLLRRAPIVFVTTDSDWNLINSQGRTDVWNQAIKCVEYLRGQGVPAVHLAPVLLCTEDHVHDKHCKTGLDDAIGYDAFEATKSLLVVPRLPQDAPSAASTSATEVYRWLLAHKLALVRAYTGEIAAALSLSKSTVRRAVDELERLGKLEFHPGEPYRGLDGRMHYKPNRYLITIPEPLSLAELGYSYSDLMQHEAGFDTEPSLRSSREQELTLGRATVKATESTIDVQLCEGCEKPLEGKRRSTRRFHNSTCRMRAARWAVEES
jgi:DNA-binding transcriptional ArsR family regulator